MAAVAGLGDAAAPSSLLLVVGSEFGCPGLLTYVLEELERARQAGTLRAWPRGRGALGRGSRARGWVPFTVRRMTQAKAGCLWVPAEEGCPAPTPGENRGGAWGPAQLGHCSASRLAGPPRGRAWGRFGS
ncbi:hypothetical protein P7K49_033591 [Saguinus oedipus]|uniref:Microtubule-associated protein 1S n=1 Tax=Saguinus oedipus TaxID=9490 RepID=A0ABQ9TSS3_SAGOE|nr:hypothetical protein P7K49_033591 [Saguinus oedipus]